MKILVVDDEPYALDDILEQIEKALPGNTVRSYHDGETALAELRRDDFKPDVCFLDIEMYGMSGLLLAKNLKDFVPYANIVFTTGYKDYALDAMQARASGYILKPVSVEAIKKEMENLRYPPVRQAEKKIVVRAFGNFEVTVDGKAVKWRRSRAKELFAFLIDSEGEVGIRSVKTTLFEDNLLSPKLDAYVQVVITEMKNSLASYGAEKALIRSRGILKLDKSMIDCDYWRFLDGDVTAIDAYQGVYMNEYAWAIMTENRLNRRL